jgi:hypothetical protein
VRNAAAIKVSTEAKTGPHMVPTWSHVNTLVVIHLVFRDNIVCIIVLAENINSRHTPASSNLALNAINPARTNKINPRMYLRFDEHEYVVISIYVLCGEFNWQHK